jgi:hypothetical protein
MSSWPFDSDQRSTAGITDPESSLDISTDRTMDVGEPKRTPSWYEAQSPLPSPIKNHFRASVISPISPTSDYATALSSASHFPHTPTVDIAAAAAGGRTPVPPVLNPPPIIANPHYRLKRADDPAPPVRSVGRHLPHIEAAAESADERHASLGALHVANMLPGDVSSASEPSPWLGDEFGTPREAEICPRFGAVTDGGLPVPWLMRKPGASHSDDDSRSVSFHSLSSRTRSVRSASPAPEDPWSLAPTRIGTPRDLEAQTDAKTGPKWTASSLTATLRSAMVTISGGRLLASEDSATADSDDAFTPLPKRAQRHRSVRTIDWDADRSDSERSSVSPSSSVNGGLAYGAGSQPPRLQSIVSRPIRLRTDSSGTTSSNDSNSQSMSRSGSMESQWTECEKRVKELLKDKINQKNSVSI